ncbi:hypothetical protein [Bradyrhizobium sp. USDA 3650]
MPRFDRVHNIPRRDFRAPVEDLRATQSGESTGSRHSGEKPAGSRGSIGEFVQKRVNLPQAPHAAIRVRISDAGHRSTVALTRRTCRDHT